MVREEVQGVKAAGKPDLVLAEEPDGGIDTSFNKTSRLKPLTGREVK